MRRNAERLKAVLEIHRRALRAENRSLRRKRFALKREAAIRAPLPALAAFLQANSASVYVKFGLEAQQWLNDIAIVKAKVKQKCAADESFRKDFSP